MCSASFIREKRIDSYRDKPCLPLPHNNIPVSFILFIRAYSVSNTSEKSALYVSRISVFYFSLSCSDLEYHVKHYLLYENAGYHKIKKKKKSKNVK